MSVLREIFKFNAIKLDVIKEIDKLVKFSWTIVGSLFKVILCNKLLLKWLQNLSSLKLKFNNAVE